MAVSFSAAAAAAASTAAAASCRAIPLADLHRLTFPDFSRTHPASAAVLVLPRFWAAAFSSAAAASAAAFSAAAFAAAAGFSTANISLKMACDSNVAAHEAVTLSSWACSSAAARYWYWY
jgi:hypothetical protein